MSLIRRVVRGAVAADVFPGAVVVVRDGGQSRTLAVGRADLATGAPMTAGDRFQVASLTKSMVAAVALKLVTQGRLSLSDTVEKWEPALLPRGAEITVADLLGQTSGLPDYTPIVTSHYVSGHTSTAPPALVGAVVHLPLMFSPGSRSFYSNTNYVVLGMILQKVSHEPLATLLQQELFGPLGLRSASLAESRTRTPPLAHGYDNRRDVTNPELTWLWAAGGVVSDIGDVARFYDALLSGRVVHGTLLDRMLTMRRETNPDLPYSGYGLGVGTIQTSCGAAYGATGDIPGFHTYALTARDRSRSVVIAENASLSVAVEDQLSTVINDALCG
ncbi:MAG TPA: serine hydrolase domain-containing protein [Nocardioides sp.]|uniref:serine hydrolase domain-containing protein n=1 Tax=Nocardioides sp. TaxID=35761 RepID=UPI002F42AE67